MENKWKKRSVADIGEDNTQVHKKLKANDISYDADSEDSSSDSETHSMEYILSAADYFAPEVDEFEADSGHLQNVSVYDALSPNLNNDENSTTDSSSQATEDCDLHECLAGVPLDYSEPEVDEFVCDSAEYLMDNYNIDVIDLTSTDDESAAKTLVSLPGEVELNVQNRAATVKIEKNLSVIDLTSTDEESL